MPHLYDGRMLANMLGTPCVGCRATVSKKWVGRGPYACTRRPCQRILAAAPCNDGHAVVALDDLVDLLDALPVAKDAGAALGDAAAAASPRPRSTRGSTPSPEPQIEGVTLTLPTPSNR